MKALCTRGIVAVGFGLLLFSTGCEPVTTDSLADFAGDFVRSLIAALLL